MGLKSLVVVIVVYHGHILSGYEIETIFHYNYSLQLSLPMMKIEGMLHMHTSSCVALLASVRRSLVYISHLTFFNLFDADAGLGHNP
jgi:hypothetical protein